MCNFILIVKLQFLEKPEEDAFTKLGQKIASCGNLLLSFAYFIEALYLFM